MTYQEKLDIVVKAIKKEQEKDPDNPFIDLTFSSDKDLNKIPIDEVISILGDLQNNEKIIKSEMLLQNSQAEGKDNAYNYLLGSKLSLELEILEGFENWYSHHIYLTENPLENLPSLSIVRIYEIATKINETLQLSPSPRISFNLWFDMGLPIQYETDEEAIELINQRRLALGYLERNSIIIDPVIKHSTVYSGLETPEIIADMTVNVAKIREFLPKITAVYKEKCEQQEQKAPTSEKPKKDAEISQEPIKRPQREVVYEIKYTTAREIFLNGFLLSKPDFNSENDNVFDYIYRNPNKKINIEELKKQAGGNLTKGLHKIVENLGFKGELKKAFFNISKNDIFFRNPLTQKALDDLGISRLKLPK